MHQIFISYRRDGGEAMAQLIFDRLTSLGYSVFYDIESLNSGPFDTKIYSKIEECTDFILILPPQALDRCVYEGDWVRNEIRHALKCGKNIVPIMMRGFVFPKDLPDDISAVSRENGVVFDNMEYLGAKMERISSMLLSKPDQANTDYSATATNNGRATSKIPTIISNVCTIGSNNHEDCWPKGYYSNTINRDLHSIVYFHLNVSNVPKGKNKIDSGMKIYNTQGNLIFHNVTEFDWQDNYDKVARSFIIKGDDGSFISEGKYKAEFWIDDSEIYEHVFEITSNSVSQTVEQQPKKQKKKKSSKPIVILAVILAFFLLGKYVIAPSMSGEKDSGVSSQTGTSTTSSDTVSIPNAAYTEIFTSRNIVAMPAMFFGLDAAEFAKVDADGNVENLAYGYKDDKVMEMVDTLYMPVTDYTDQQKNELEKNIKATFANYEAEEFCTAKYQMGNNYYIITLDFKELDKKQNIDKLSEWGITTGGSLVNYISLEKTESGLLANGFVKK